MYPEVIRSGLTLPKVLGGISKTINVLNKAIPLYEQAKPLWNNAKTALQVLKVMNEPDKKSQTKVSEEPTKKEVVTSLSTPQFFQ